MLSNGLQLLQFGPQGEGGTQGSRSVLWVRFIGDSTTLGDRIIYFSRYLRPSRAGVETTEEGKEQLLDFLPSISALVSSSVSAACLVERTETCIALGMVSSLFTSKFNSQDFAEYFTSLSFCSDTSS